MDSVTARKAEAFICSLYNVSNRIPTSADEARYLLFCQKAQSNLQLPPTSDSLLQHIKRANYQAYVWRKALVPRQDLPTPAGNGWTIQGNSLFPQLMTKPPAPESILELVNCQCSKSSCTQKCSCSNNGLACTEACKCIADENCHNPNKACDYDSDDYDDLPVDYLIIRHYKSRTYFSFQSFKLVYTYKFSSRLKQICFVNKYEFRAVTIKRNYKKHAG